MLYIERRLNKANGYKYLTRLRETVRKVIEVAKGAKENVLAASSEIGAVTYNFN